MLMSLHEQFLVRAGVYTEGVRSWWDSVNLWPQNTLLMRAGLDSMCIWGGTWLPTSLPRTAVQLAAIMSTVQWELAIVETKGEKNTKLDQNLCDTAQAETVHYELNKDNNYGITHSEEAWQESRLTKAQAPWALRNDVCCNEIIFLSFQMHLSLKSLHIMLCCQPLKMLQW